MKAVLFTAAAAIALSACSGGNESTADGDAAEGATTAAAIDGAADGTAEASAESAMPAGAQGFVDQASASDMYEIEAGKLAQQMGKSQAVKDFGTMMVTEHTKSSTDLKAAAGSADGITVAPKLTAKQTSELEALRSAGDGFDATYKTQQVAAHTQALALLRGYGANGDVPALKAFATKTAPVVEKHLAQARQLP